MPFATFNLGERSQDEFWVRDLKNAFYFFARQPAKLWRQLTIGRAHPLFDESWYLFRYPAIAQSFTDPYSDFRGNSTIRDPNPLFESSWYFERHNRLLDGLSPLDHYVLHANDRNVQPTSLFDTSYYIEQNGGALVPNINPLLHYITIGCKKGLSPNPLFNTDWYLTRYPDVAHGRMNPLAHFSRFAAAEHRLPHPLFDTAWYVENHPDVKRIGINPLSHFLQNGAREGRDPHPLFSFAWYASQQPKLDCRLDNLLVHYLENGSKERRDPHPLFDTEFYLKTANAAPGDVGNPLVHYLTNRNAGSHPNELFNNEWYLEQYKDVREAGMNPLVHYVLKGARQGHDPSPGFSTSWYLSEYQDVDPETMNPLAHYLRYGRAEGRRPLGFRGLRVSHNLRARQLKTLNTRFDAFLNSGKSLVFAPSEAPVLSIIIVACNNGHHTFACLDSLRSSLSDSEIGYEVILYDNGSTGRSRTLLCRLANVHIIQGKDNKGFIHGANASSVAAKGEFLLFLNNDTEVPFGTLENAIAVLRGSSDVGVVGGKLILPDATLQEAGSIVWNDGTCLGYCRGQDPDDFEANFQRDVDYCSGAFLLTRRALFFALRRFDETFSPGYYEETDYCMRLWSWGYRVVYDPFVTVFHFEFGTAADASKAAALQVQNLPKFVLRHEAELAHHHYPPNDRNILFAARRKQNSGRLLIVDDRVPHPHLGSGFPRAMAIMNGFAALGIQVTLLPTDDRFQDWASVRGTLDRRIEVAFGYARDELVGFIEERRGLYGAILVSRPHNIESVNAAIEADASFLGACPLIYDSEALFCNRDISRHEVAGTPLSTSDVNALREQELALARFATTVLCVTDRERAEFVSAGSKDVRVLGHNMPTKPGRTPFRERQDILFVGPLYADDTPNGDSVVWFIDEVLPALRRRISQPFRLILAGENRSPAIKQRLCAEIVSLGRVDDLAPLYESSRIFVAPTRFAAGLPHKIHEAAGKGMPVVATKILVDQLRWKAEGEILVGNDALSFAEACARLYSDPVVWETIRSGGLEAVDRDCSPKAFSAALDRLSRDLFVSSRAHPLS
jgi:GT2 family glycosyltransferase